MKCPTCLEDTGYVVPTWHCECETGYHVLMEINYCEPCSTPRDTALAPMVIDVAPTVLLSALLEKPWQQWPDMDYEQWEGLVVGARRYERRKLWFWGGLLNFGEAHFGEKYSQALEASDYASGSLRNAAWVDRVFPEERRHYALGWSFHQAVAHLEVEEQDKLLNWAEESGATREMLRDAVKATKEIEQEVDPFVTLDAEVEKLIRLINRLWPDDQTGAKARVVERLQDE